VSDLPRAPDVVALAPDVGLAIAVSPDLDEMLAVIARRVAEALGAEQCQIQEYDAAANTVTPVAFWQRHTERPEPESMHKTFSLAGEPEERAFLEATQVVQQLCSDPELAGPTRAIMDKYGDLSYLNVPLVFGDQAFGVMVLVETEVERCWSDEEVALARALGEQAAVAIEHARLYRRVQDQAITDGLTGLFNHRYFYERLEEEIARARRYGTPASLLMGEFAIILPNTPMGAVPETQMEMNLAGKLAKAGDADAALYKAKRAGKDRVESYG